MNPDEFFKDLVIYEDILDRELGEVPPRIYPNKDGISMINSHYDIILRAIEAAYYFGLKRGENRTERMYLNNLRKDYINFN